MNLAQLFGRLPDYIRNLTPDELQRLMEENTDAINYIYFLHMIQDFTPDELERLINENQQRINLLNWVINHGPDQYEDHVDIMTQNNDDFQFN